MNSEAESGPQSTRILSIDQLIIERKEGPHSALFSASVGALSSESTQSLLMRFKTTTDPVMAWAIHRQLDSRDVPPCLRDAPPGATDQLAFITWSADMLWFTKRHPTHKPRYKRWAGLFKHEPGSPDWCRTAAWVYRQSGRHDAHYFANALNLSDRDRQDLVKVPTHSMVADRQLLATVSWKYERQIMDHALKHRDRAGKVTPAEVTQGRLEVLRAFLLAGRRPVLAVRFLEAATGRKISRQTLTEHIEAIEVATGLRLIR